MQPAGSLVMVVVNEGDGEVWRTMSSAGEGSFELQRGLAGAARACREPVWCGRNLATVLTTLGRSIVAWTGHDSPPPIRTSTLYP